jgi:threonine synthase
MLKCFACPKIYDEESPIWRCECGSFLVHNFEKTPRLEPREIRSRELDWWRYSEALPLRWAENRVRLAEGPTPLTRGTLAGEEVLFKNDGHCFTGSFKDRGTFLMMSKFREWGLTEIVEDSSGNAGASVAAYARQAGIRAQIFAPAYTEPDKLMNISRYGADLIKVSGTREDTAQAAVNAADNSYYASHNWNPYFPSGVKSLAYEIWEQLGFTAPDRVVVPAGGGSSLLGLYYGFMELAETGRIDHLPRLTAVQSAACNPLCKSFTEQALTTSVVTKHPTVAEGIVIADPVKGAAMLKALYDTQGACISVSEAEILLALEALEAQGYQVEPTAAVSAAGCTQGLRRGIISSEETTVVLLTGRKKK